MIVVQPMILIFLKFSIKFVCTKNQPAIITGKDETIIFKKRSLFFVKFIMSL